MMKPIFSRNEYIDRMAFLNWRMSFGKENNLNELAEGYLVSSLYLIDQCLLDNEDKKADIVIFPILTCINHGIELYLKSLILILNSKLNNGYKLDGTHNLKQLINTLRARIKDNFGQKEMNDFDQKFIQLTSYIDELIGRIGYTEKDDKMDFSRYPFSKKFEDHFYVDVSKNCEVDLVNLGERVEIILELFDQYSNFIIYNE